MRYLVVLLLVGCAMTPQELTTAGIRTEHASERSPEQAARCVARNAEELKLGWGVNFPATWREGKEPGTFEVVLHGGADYGTLGFAKIEPHGGGSRITIWRAESILMGSSEINAKMAEGC